MSSTGEARIAVISDTHGLLDDRVLAFCAGADRIVHAGDVGSTAVLDKLARSAPLTAVRGNRDRHVPSIDLPLEAFGEVGGLRFVVAHKRRDLRAAHPDPEAEDFALMIYGHSHRAELALPWVRARPGARPLAEPGDRHRAAAARPAPQRGARSRARRRRRRAHRLVAE